MPFVSPLGSHRDREERLAALTAAQQEAMEELQKKIQLKVGFYVSYCEIFELSWSMRLNLYLLN